MRNALIIGLGLLGFQASAQDTGLVQNGLSDPERRARVEVVRNCYIAAPSVAEVQSCVGVWAARCAEAAVGKNEVEILRCEVDEAGTWQALAMFLGTQSTDAAQGQAGGLAAWTDETVAECGPDPVAAQMTGEATRDGATCWARAAAKRAFLLGKGGGE